MNALNTTFAPRTIKKQKGFTMIELLVVTAILVVMGIGVKMALSPQISNGDVKSTMKMVEAVRTAVGQWKPYNSVLTGVSMTALNDLDLIPEAWGDGSNITPLGGGITVAVSGSDTTRMVISVTGIPTTEIGNRMVRDYADLTVVTPTFSGSTLSLTFKG